MAFDSFGFGSDRYGYGHIGLTIYNSCTGTCLIFAEGREFVRKASKETQTGRRVERRKEGRFTLILRVGVLEQSGKSSLCLVRNISTLGVQLKCYSNPKVDAPASIRVADEPEVLGRIIWLNDAIAGMTFDQELDAATLLRVRQKLKPNRRRAMPRLDVQASAILRVGGKTTRADVCDISSLGVRVRTTLPLRSGDRAIVEFSDLPSLPGFVRWADGHHAGLAFETPIPMQIIAHWIEGRIKLSA